MICCGFGSGFLGWDISGEGIERKCGRRFARELTLHIAKVIMFMSCRILTNIGKISLGSVIIAGVNELEFWSIGQDLLDWSMEKFGEVISV